MINRQAVSGPATNASRSPDEPVAAHTSDQILAAGGVLWRYGLTGNIEVAGIYRPACDNWSLPKGKLDPGETPLAAACREVYEETGHRTQPQAFLTSARYELSRPGGSVTKVVDYWSMRALDPSTPFVATKEVTAHRWLDFNEALEVLSRPRDQTALREFGALPTITATVIIVRHAHAATRSGTDVARPLNDEGKRQVHHLTPLLELYRPTHILSATPRRCVETISPLADTAKLPVRPDSMFDEESHLRDPEGTAHRIRQFAKTHSTTVVCTHAPVISDAVAILSDTDGLDICNVDTSPGEAWILSFANRVLVAAERL